MNIESADSDKLTWLAHQIFTAFPQEVTGLKFYIFDCGRIYYQGGFRDGNLDPQVDIHRDAEDRLCEICVLKKESWEDRVIDEAMICSGEFQELA